MIQKKVTDFFALEGNYPDLDGGGAAARLSAAIRCKTINYFDHSRTDYTEFDKLHAHIKASYPNIMRVGTFERIGHRAVLITIPGSDASLRPCLYMSHQDVVPVVEGTEQDWTHPAFSGDIADGYIWGRGTLDIKEQVFGVLEAAEYLLARGKSFARTAYLAFGDDEETINLGALAIAEHLKAQGVTLEFVLDEGGCKIEPGTAFGAPETSIVSVQLMEKGYAAVIIQNSAGSGNAVEYNKSILTHSTLLASIRMPIDLFVGKSSVQTHIYVFRVGEAHQKDDVVKFIDFSNDGYTRSARKKSTNNLRDTDNAKERYQELVNLVRFGKSKMSIFAEQDYYEGVIDPENGADWRQELTVILNS